MKCTCVQCPELRQTGDGPPKADLYCPVCPLVFWSHNGIAEKERPFAWPGKKDESIQTWELKGGGWKTV